VLVFIVSVLLLSWLLLQAVHELGHVLAAWMTGGTVQRVVLDPLTISRTDVDPNPQPLVVTWAGPLFGSLTPLAVWALLEIARARLAWLARFFAGACLLANGLYLGADHQAWQPDLDAVVVRTRDGAGGLVALEWPRPEVRPGAESRGSERPTGSGNAGGAPGNLRHHADHLVMKLKRIPEDFQVDELVALQPGDSGPFALYRLTKQSLGTREAIDAIIERWRMPRGAIAFAGLKDRHALTRQYVTIQSGPPRGFGQTNFELEAIAFRSCSAT
jgi:hypothetical protein